MKTEIPPILEGVKQFILDWANRTTDPYEVIRKSGKIAKSTILRILDPKDIPTEKTLLGFNAINFESATGVSIYEFVIAQAKTGLWNTEDKLPEIRTHDQLVGALSKVYKTDPEERFKMLNNRADFDSRRDLNDTIAGRPLFWKRIPGILETVAFYTKEVEPRGAPKGESAFETAQPKEESGGGLLVVEPVGVGHAVNCIASTANLINALHIDPLTITQIQKMGVLRALVSIALKFEITPASLERPRNDQSGGTAIDVLTNALNNQMRKR